MSDRNEPEYFTVDVKVETDKALLCEFDDGREEWIPKSQILPESQVQSKGDDGEIAIPRWLAEAKGLM